MSETDPDVGPEQAAGDARRWFVSRQLPWLLGLLFLLFYIVTLARWVSLPGLETASRICGWLWKPELLRPVTYFVLSPLGLLPERWTLICLNLASALFAGLTLTLLARSVVLWPRPARRMRTQFKVDSLSGLSAAIPPLLAVVACGLNLNFWEHATSGTGEMLEVLMLAYVIRCLLEHRRDHHDTWIYKAVSIFTASMANSWVSVALAPLFFVAVVAVKRMGMLNGSFAARFCGSGVAGLMFYFLWPVVNTITSDAGFWDVLKGNLNFQKQMLLTLKRPVWIALALTCVAPLVAISIHWRKPKSDASDDNPLSILFSRGLIHLAHVGLLCLGVWMALGAAFSPRHLSRSMGLPLLPLDYFSALVIGYCAGYVLLIRSVRFHLWANLATQGALVLLTVALPILLLGRNLSQIAQTNGRDLRAFAKAAADALPQGPVLLLSDEPALLLLIQAELASRPALQVLPVDSRHLKSAEYRTYLARKHPRAWLPIATQFSGTLAPDAIAQLLVCWPNVFYLHPSFGYYFERFRSEPANGIYRLVPRTSGGRAEPRALSFHGATWTNLLSRLTAKLERERTFEIGASASWTKHLKLAAERNATLGFLGTVYARELNSMGVQLQREGKWEDAATAFGVALAVRPVHRVAAANMAFNRQYSQSGERTHTDHITREILQLQAGLHMTLRESGPVDVPALLDLTGQIFQSGGNYHQALEAFQRAAELEPTRPEPPLNAAQSFTALGKHEEALGCLERAARLDAGKNPRLTAIALACRVQALQRLNRTSEIPLAISSALKLHPEAPEVLSIAAQIHLALGQFANAIPYFDKLLDIAPNQPELLVGRGLAELATQPEAALEKLNQAVSLAPSNSVIRLNRAVASLKAGRLDLAEVDLEFLTSVHPNSPSLLIAQGELAWRKREFSTASRYYRQLLANTATNSPEHQLVLERLRQIQE